MNIMLRIVCSLSCLVYLATSLPVPSEDLKQKTLERENEVALLDNADEALRAAALDIAALKLEDLYEQEVINTALDILKKERKTPDKALDDLQELGKTVRRDKRKVEVLTAALGASSGALSAGASGSSSAGGSGDGGEGGDSSGGSGSSSILGLIGPLLGSSSGGGGGGGDEEGGGGSNILGLLSGLLGSSSGGGGADGDSGDANASGGGGSGSGSILSLLGPLLGSSSGGGGGGGGEEGGDSSGGSGSDSGSILSLLGPLLGSSSGGGGGGASAGGGGGAGVNAGISAGATGDQLFTSKDPISLLGDKVQLILRIKFAFLTKILQTLSGVLSSSTQPQSEQNGMLVYPPPKKGLF